MILTCPACTTRYAVTPESIGPAGRDVRCAKCGHRWFQTPEISTAADSPQEIPPVMPRPERAAPLPSGSGLPVKIPAIVTPRGLMITALLSLLVSLLALVIVFQSFIVSHLPITGSLYNSVGLYDTGGLALADIKVEKAGSELRDNFTISGVVINRSAQEKPVPVVRIALRLEDGSMYRYWDFEQAGKRIKPGESLPFLADNLEAKTKHVGSVAVELGNRVELGMRR